MFQRTTAINKLLALKKRKKVIQGGTWAGKTYGIIPIIINHCASNPGEQFTIVAESVPALKKGAIKDFKEIMMSTSRWIEGHFSRSDKKYTFTNGSYIEFSSFQTIGDAKAAGKRTGLFINEGQYIAFDIADALMTRTSGEIWIDFNPTKNFWAHEELVDTGEADFIILTYKDNEGLPDSILDDLMLKKEKAFYDVNLPIESIYENYNIKNKYWANWCKVYLDGLIGNLDGVIFTNWSIIDNIPKEAKLLGNGMDFGFSIDPTTWLSLWKYNNVPIFDEHFYQTELLNKQIADLMKKKDEHHALTVADSSSPQNIKELTNYGINIKGATKGPGSVNFGISILQENKFYVTANSLNTIKELRNYLWKVDKEGKTLNEPIDINNHCIDPMRYAAVEFLSNKPKHKSF
jgi:phage terminase large subunit